MSKVRVRLGNSTSDLLQELVERGVMKKIIGEDAHLLVGGIKTGRAKANKTIEHQNELRAEQRKRLEEILHE